ncbi:MAG: hypothetical protein JXN59_18040 [Anaerolineae bacterium]|nr:hypothetical protein [Anaerolineae bacterium]
MVKEPDWEALSQLQFLLMRRITEPLNASLSAVALVHLDSAANRPREYWQDRATREVLGVLNLVNAWHALIRFKQGELLPQQHIRPFNAQDLLDWLTTQLELSNPLRIKEDMMLESSKEALQEALLLLYSAAYTLGPNVHLLVKSLTNGVWFRVRYSHSGRGAAPLDLNDLLDQLKGNWRLEDTAFELRLAHDFITLSGGKLHFQSTESFCELAFFVYALGKRPPEPLKDEDVDAPPPITETRAEEIMLAISSKDQSDLITHRFSEQELTRMVDRTVLEVFGKSGTVSQESPAVQESPAPSEDSSPAEALSPTDDSGSVEDDSQAGDDPTFIPPHKPE